MKKMFFMAAIAGVALASCAKNEVETPEQDIITFAEPVTAVQTKATEITANYPMNKHFSVFAYYYEGDYTKFEDGKLYMNDVETAYSSDVHGWDPAKVSGVNYYWPKQGTLTFAAYSPSTVAATHDKAGLHFEGFTVPAKAEEQYDLLFSERSYNQTNATMNDHTNHYKGVEITFNHALSSIIFKAKTDINYNKDNFYITVKEVTVKHISSTADFCQGLNDEEEILETANTEACWSDWSSEIDYTAYAGEYTLKDGEYALVPGITPGVMSNDTDIQNSHLILIPQSLADAKLYVKYTIYNKNVNPVAAIDQTAELDLATTKVATWLRGKRYTYNITIGLDKIYFDPVVNEWVNVDGGSFTVGNAGEKTN